MKDCTLIEQFEACTLDPETFRHRDHIHLAWSYLKELNLPEAMIKLRDGLKRFTAHLGKSDRYHETVTFAYLVLLNERIKRGNGLEDWESFSKNNLDLFIREPSLLDKFYNHETLNSLFAKQIFLWPDRVN